MAQPARRTAAALVTAVAASLLTTVLPVASADATLVNDYPYRTDTTWSTERWGFTKRQCVSFTAWRLAQHGHAISNTRQHWGSAYHWDDAARALHRTVTTTPRLGAVAQWNAWESSAYYSAGATRPTGRIAAGAYGHVGYVSRVWADHSVTIEQYNIDGSRGYSSMHVKAPRYLYVG